MMLTRSKTKKRFSRKKRAATGDLTISSLTKQFGAGEIVRGGKLPTLQSATLTSR
jgi:hypothetical protein